MGCDCECSGAEQEATIQLLFFCLSVTAPIARANPSAGQVELNLQECAVSTSCLANLTSAGLLEASDVCLVSQQKAVSEIAFPSKIVTYLAAGRPIIATVNLDSEVARVTQTSGAGKVVETRESQGSAGGRFWDLRGQGSALATARTRAKIRARRWSFHPGVAGNLEQWPLTAVAGSAAGSMMKEGVQP